MGNELVKLEEYQYALAQVETVEEAGALRAKIETVAKQIAPRLRQDRFKWCRANVEACIKHGEMWNACENKMTRAQNQWVDEELLKNFISIPYIQWLLYS